MEHLDLAQVERPARWRSHPCSHALACACHCVRPSALPHASPNAALQAALQASDVRKGLAALGAEPAGGSPAQFRKLIDAETAKWRALIKSAHIEQLD
ncbi:hypothetical protein KB879_21960 [Cupriavidus sp. KK10]|nr:hypothetical protein KB879_21960 [Cupriavidus sp. KK10]